MIFVKGLRVIIIVDLNWRAVKFVLKVKIKRFVVKLLVLCVNKSGDLLKILKTDVKFIVKCKERKCQKM